MTMSVDDIEKSVQHDLTLWHQIGGERGLDADDAGVFDKAPRRTAKMREIAASLPFVLVVDKNRSTRMVLDCHCEPTMGTSECRRLLR